MRILDLVFDSGIPAPTSCRFAFSSSSVQKANQGRVGCQVVNEETSNT